MSVERPTPTWRDVCAAFAVAEGVRADLLSDLDAFLTAHPRGGAPPPAEPPWAGDFGSLEARFAAPLDAAQITRRLSRELDGLQPAIFARRTASTESILAALNTPAARILRVGLRVRLEGILEAPPPRGRRVRALADYYYSLAARLRHPEWDTGRHLEALVANARWRDVAPGIRHATLDGTADGMPVHANLLSVDPHMLQARVVDLHPATAAGRSFAQAAGAGVVAAVSGGFFLYSEDDVTPPSARHDPVGLLLSDGAVRNPPTFRRAAFLAGERGEVEIRRIGPGDVEVRVAGRSLTASAWWNRARAERGPGAPSVAIVGQRVVAVGTRLPVPLNGVVAVAAPEDLVAISAGDEVTWLPPRLASGRRATQGIAGGPLLVRAGRPAIDMRGEEFWGTAPPITFSQDETGDRNLLARLGLGVDEAGRIVLAAVDGRNVERALGMTLADVARLMIRLGCVRAMNLDGGSSKRMLVDGRVVDLASTEIVAGETRVLGTRPVHTALTFGRPAASS